MRVDTIDASASAKRPSINLCMHHVKTTPINRWLTTIGISANTVGLIVKATPNSAVIVTTLLARGAKP